MGLDCRVHARVVRRRRRAADAFVFIELRSPQPLVRLSFFKKRWISSANATMFVVAGGMFGMFYFASLYVQQILGFNAWRQDSPSCRCRSGSWSAPVSQQQLIGRVGVKPVVMVGMALASIGLIILASTTQVDGTYPALLAGLIPMSLGMGMTFVPLTLVATAGVEPADAGLASGVFNTSQQIGGALGLAILATFSVSRTEGLLEGVSDATDDAADADGDGRGLPDGLHGRRRTDGRRTAAGDASRCAAKTSTTSTSATAIPVAA